VRDYLDWHDDYEKPGTPLHQRLQVVIELLEAAFDASPPGPIQLLSLCAGQGADVLGAAERHPRGGDLVGTLVELDPRNVEIARQRIDGLGLDRLTVVEADAGWSDPYEAAVPADVVVACGIFGNISDADIERTIRFLPALCAPGARALWTRHPREPKVFEDLQGWFVEAGFEHLRVVVDDDGHWGVGSARLTGSPAPFRPGEHLFDFVR
jgi:hypothetical protein